MIRRDPSIPGKNETNVPSNVAPSNPSPVTILRPVTVLPGNSGSPASINGSPVVYLIAPNNSNVRLGVPQQHSSGTPQPTQRVLLVQIPSKNVASSAGSTSQPPKTIIASPATNFALKRPAFNQQTPSPHTYHHVVLSRSDDSNSTPPIKRLAVNGPPGSSIRPVGQPSALSSMNLQQVMTIPGASPSLKLVTTPTVFKGANLVRLEQARSAVRAVAAESQHNLASARSRIEVATTSHTQHAQHTPVHTPHQPHVVQNVRRAQEVTPAKPPPEHGIMRFFNADRQMLAQPKVSQFRVPTWSKWSEAVLALLPYHLYDTSEPPVVDLLEHDLSFSARCQQLLSRKEHLKQRVARAMFKDESSREKLESLLSTKMMVERLKEPDIEETEDNLQGDLSSGSEQDNEEDVESFLDVKSEPIVVQARDSTPRLVIRLGAESRNVSTVQASSVDVNRVNHQLTESGVDFRSNLSNNNVLPTAESLSSLPGEDSPSKPFIWNNNVMTSPSFNSPEMADRSLSAPDSSLSEAELAVQSIL